MNNDVDDHGDHDDDKECGVIWLSSQRPASNPASRKRHLINLGTGGVSKTDEFSEKFQKNLFKGPKYAT